ncbi:DUF115 domain-containing protein [Brevibacillus ruminantium]|uniref:DUF115 domain-containing protein n=1 Tax=Brevibacillus ruminantium TaxID=2950604 RepID=A0ABY4WF04_9BACL|nr:6-hydroxymethylpterin diphosphokinase MptE-like protein [Brevibacillus ruminantium]USG65324.1 DUF115 domain-containing protein [Brevibacillus ruminantium]
MILIENVIFLKNKFPFTWDLVKAEEEKGISDEVRVESTRTGMKTLSIQTVKGANYLHSKYDPVSEAEKIIENYSDVGEYQHVFFYGIGLGYHIDKFLEKYPNIPFTLYEPDMNIFQTLLSNKKLEDWSSKSLMNIYAGHTPELISKNLTHFINAVKEKVMLFILPGYERIFTDLTRKFVSEFRDVVYAKASYIYANVVFSKRQPINSIVNVTTTFKTPNIIHEKPESFQGKPAILVAAGPSLDFEYENLRYIKENGLAYIFSVGSAINSLIENGIYPDAACTYDGSERNHLVFSKVVERGITDIPLIYGSMVGYETVEKYPGPMMHFLVGGDYFSNFILKSNNNLPIDYVLPAKSIAIITLQLLHKLGCSPIILAGQNLAYLKERTYAQGMTFTNEITEAQKTQAILVKDVEGNDVYTNRGLDGFRKEMEDRIKKLSDVVVINTTRGGAHIEGTKFEPLTKVIDERLQNRVVDQKWLTKFDYQYNQEYLCNKIQELLFEQKEFTRISNLFYRLFHEMEHYMESYNSKNLGKCFNKFDKLFDKLQDNKFYRLLLQPMNQLLFENILKLMGEIRFKQDEYSKAKNIIAHFTNFLKHCESDMNTIKPLIEKIDEKVLEWNRGSEIETPQ